jgi:hypothetical protein
MEWRFIGFGILINHLLEYFVYPFVIKHRQRYIVVSIALTVPFTAASDSLSWCNAFSLWGWIHCHGGMMYNFGLRESKLRDIAWRPTMTSNRILASIKVSTASKALLTLLYSKWLSKQTVISLFLQSLYRCHSRVVWQFWSWKWWQYVPGPCMYGSYSSNLCFDSAYFSISLLTWKWWWKD